MFCKVYVFFSFIIAICVHASSSASLSNYKRIVDYYKTFDEGGASPYNPQSIGPHNPDYQQLLLNSDNSNLPWSSSSSDFASNPLKPGGLLKILDSAKTAWRTFISELGQIIGKSDGPDLDQISLRLRESGPDIDPFFVRPGGFSKVWSPNQNHHSPEFGGFSKVWSPNQNQYSSRSLSPYIDQFSSGPWNPKQDQFALRSHSPNIDQYSFEFESPDIDPFFVRPRRRTPRSHNHGQFSSRPLSTEFGGFSKASGSPDLDQFSLRPWSPKQDKFPWRSLTSDSDRLPMGPWSRNQDQFSLRSLNPDIDEPFLAPWSPNQDELSLRSWNPDWGQVSLRSAPYSLISSADVYSQEFPANPEVGSFRSALEILEDQSLGDQPLSSQPTAVQSLSGPDTARHALPLESAPDRTPFDQVYKSSLGIPPNPLTFKSSVLLTAKLIKSLAPYLVRSANSVQADMPLG